MRIAILFVFLYNVHAFLPSIPVPKLRDRLVVRYVSQFQSKISRRSPLNMRENDGDSDVDPATLDEISKIINSEPYDPVPKFSRRPIKSDGDMRLFEDRRSKMDPIRQSEVSTSKQEFAMNVERRTV